MEFNSTLVLIVLGVYLAFMLYLGFFLKTALTLLATSLLAVGVSLGL